MSQTVRTDRWLALAKAGSWVTTTSASCTVTKRLEVNRPASRRKLATPRAHLYRITLRTRQVLLSRRWNFLSARECSLNFFNKLTQSYSACFVQIRRDDRP